MMREFSDVSAVPKKLAACLIDPHSAPPNIIECGEGKVKP